MRDGAARAQGGFIWDWVDQGLLKWVTNADGERVEAWAYGGDFGEPVHDAQFCINGLVFPNREPHPACHECKAVMVRARAAQHAHSHSGSRRAEHEAEPAFGMRGLAEGEPTWRRGYLDPSNLGSCCRTLALRAFLSHRGRTAMGTERRPTRRPLAGSGGV